MVTDKHIAQLWLRMTRIYGHRWSSGFGEADDGTWLAGLKNLEPENLAQGLRASIDSGMEWPPSLPEFRHMSLGITKAVIREAAKKMIPSFDRQRMSQRDLEREISRRMQDATTLLVHERIDQSQSVKRLNG